MLKNLWLGTTPNPIILYLDKIGWNQFHNLPDLPFCGFNLRFLIGWYRMCCLRRVRDRLKIVIARPGHKWFCGAKGTALLHVGEEERCGRWDRCLCQSESVLRWTKPFCKRYSISLTSIQHTHCVNLLYTQIYWLPHTLSLSLYINK